MFATRWIRYHGLNRWFVAGVFIALFSAPPLDRAHAGSWDRYRDKLQPILSAENDRLNKKFSHDTSLSVNVAFTLDSRGQLQTLEVRQPSGHDRYDSLVVDAVRALPPFPDPPVMVFLRQVIQSFDFTFHYQPAVDTVERNKPPTDPLVAESQELLARLGYKVGPVDGIYGQKTKAAITAFQRDLGIRVNGKATTQLLERLRSASTQSPTPDQPKPETAPESDKLATAGRENKNPEHQGLSEDGSSYSSKIAITAPASPGTSTTASSGQPVIASGPADTDASFDINYLVGTSLPEEMRPIVLVIEGVEVGMAETSNAPESPADRDDAASYLMPALEKAWPFAKEFKYHAWSGNHEETNSGTEYAKWLIESSVQRAHDQQRPFILVSYSWGSVVAYVSIRELVREDRLNASGIDQFVTLGSPLNSQDGATKNLVRPYASMSEGPSVMAAVKQWTNYWTTDDVISGPIRHAGINNIELEPEMLSRLHPGTTMKAHSVYWDKASSGAESFTNCIGLDRKYELLAPYLRNPKKTSFCTGFDELEASLKIYEPRSAGSMPQPMQDKSVNPRTESSDSKETPLTRTRDPQ